MSKPKSKITLVDRFESHSHSKKEAAQKGSLFFGGECSYATFQKVRLYQRFFGIGHYQISSTSILDADEI